MESKVTELLGKTLTAVSGMAKGGDEIRFTCSDGSEYRMFHIQDCCESVSIDDVEGDPQCLLNTPILMSEEVSSNGAPLPKGDSVESYTWTFYKFATINGYVTVKWLGESNGYYSESVDFEKL